MELKIGEFGVFVFGLLVGGLLATAIVLANFADRKTLPQLQAVEHGAARWEVAPDGSTSFHWNDDKQEEK